MLTTFKQLSPRAILIGTFLIFLGPFLAVEFIPARLDRVMDKDSYLVFHNIAEFFSIMVSLSVFGVGWYTYDQSKDRHALFLGATFLAVGLLDFMHTMSNALMPAFITPNSTNKSTQFWIAARLLDSSAFLASAFIYKERQTPWLSKNVLLAAALAVVGVVFAGVVFFPGLVPATAIPGSGLTPLKRVLEFVVILLLVAAGAAYWRRMQRTGERLLMYYLAAFIICIFSEGVFASYKTGFDTYNVFGHIYKVVAFYLIYRGVFISSVNAPYTKLAAMHDSINTLNAELENRVKERTALLEAANKELEAFAFSVSHDLRAPLRIVEGFSRAIEEEEAGRLSNTGKDYFRRVQTATEKMGQLIEAMLSLSRLTRGELSRSTIHLTGLARTVIEDLRRTDPDRWAEITVQDDIRAEGDFTMLRIVLTNLLQNAWKFTFKCEKAMIEFGALECGMPNAGCGINNETAAEKVRQGKTVYFVRDNGAGFDMSYVGKLFIPFQRLHAADEFPGIGIGLATVQRIVRRHGGKIWAEAEPGKGATFYFTL